MTVPHTREPVRHVPGDQQDKPVAGQIAYTLRTPTVYDRARLRRNVRAQGARYVSTDELRATLKAGIRKIHEQAGAPDEGASLVAYVEEFEAITADPEDADAYMQAIREYSDTIAEIEALVERAYQPYYERIADLQYWREALSLEAVRLFVTGTENLDLGPIGQRGLSDDQLTLIPSGHLEELSARCLALMAPDTETGNA